MNQQEQIVMLREALEEYDAIPDEDERFPQEHRAIATRRSRQFQKIRELIEADTLAATSQPASEAVPVGEVIGYSTYLTDIKWVNGSLDIGTKIYTAPPAQE